FKAGAGFEEVEALASDLEFLLGLFVVDLDGGEGVEMDTDDVIAANHLGAAYCVVDVHGEIAADAEDGEIEAVAVSDEFHVAGEGGVAGEVKVAFVAGDDE